MPWRETADPYAIMVSEVMLQQTQVDRVIPKFEAFMKAFPTAADLAKASFKDVLAQWTGLGYNRRAKWLQEAAQEILRLGSFPDDVDELVKLKGIGPNTAAAICVYAFNKPEVFVETNIRAVYIHHFFEDADDVYDRDIVQLVDETLDKANPREWYWALMDYGVYLKKKHKNPARRSKHHTKQSKFEGSRRQVRGNILKLLLEDGMTLPILQDKVNDDRFEDVLSELDKDGLVVRDGDQVKIA